MTSCSLTHIRGLLRVRVANEWDRSSYRSFEVSPSSSLLSLVYILIFIPIVMLRWTFPHAFGDSRIGPLGNIRLDVDHVDLMPPIISKIKPVAKSVIDFEAE